MRRFALAEEEVATLEAVAVFPLLTHALVAANAGLSLAGARLAEAVRRAVNSLATVGHVADGDIVRSTCIWRGTRSGARRAEESRQCERYPHRGDLRPAARSVNKKLVCHRNTARRRHT